MPEQTAYLLYIDDSGTKEYAENPADYGKGKSRYFVFGAVLLSANDAALLSSQIIQLKLRIFGTDAVEIKSNWLRQPKEARVRYLDEFQVTEDELAQFVAAYYDMIRSTNLTLFATVVDKVHMQERYPQPWYAPAVAYETLLQRVEMCLHGRGSVSVSVDDMTGATPKGNQYKRNLDRQHEALKKTGSTLQRDFRFDSVKGRLRFINSAHSHLVQVADVVAYNVYRQFTEHGAEWEDSTLKSLPTYDYFSRLVPKFCCDGAGRIQGYGIVKFPMIRRVPWRRRPGKEDVAP